MQCCTADEHGAIAAQYVLCVIANRLYYEGSVKRRSWKPFSVHNGQQQRLKQLIFFRRDFYRGAEEALRELVGPWPETMYEGADHLQTMNDGAMWIDSLSQKYTSEKKCEFAAKLEQTIKYY